MEYKGGFGSEFSGSTGNARRVVEVEDDPEAPKCVHLDEYQAREDQSKVCAAQALLFRSVAKSHSSNSSKKFKFPEWKYKRMLAYLGGYYYYY